MWQYTYTFEYQIVEAMNLLLDPTYKTIAIILTVLLSLTAFALTLFTAIAVKRGRVMGIIASLFQGLGLIVAQAMVFSFASIDFSNYHVIATASTKDAAETKANEMLMEAFLEHPPYGLYIYSALSLVLAFCFLMSLIYFGFLFASRGRACGIIAFIVAMLTMVFVTPVNVFLAWLNWLDMSSLVCQYVQDAVFRTLYMLPSLLISIQGIINLVATIARRRAQRKAELDVAASRALSDEA